MVGLQAIEVRQALRPSPRGRPASSPSVVVLGLPSQREARVDARAAAKDATARQCTPSLAVEVVPVVLVDATAESHIPNRVRNVVPRVRSGLEEQHPNFRIFTQTAGDDPAARA